MITFTHRVAGNETLIHFPEHADDLQGFADFLIRSNGQVLGLDTETTGLAIYSKGFACRLVQFGSAMEAWVLRVDRFREAIRRALGAGRQWVAHNAPFDLLVLDRTGLAALSDLGPRVFDTFILGHLCDPRMEREGGTGLSLKPLSAIYVDNDAVDTQDGLDAVFLTLYREWTKTVDKETVAEWKRLHPKKPHKAWGFSNIAIDHPLYIRYAGLDVIYATRLLRELGTLVKGNGLSKLAHFEHRVQLVTTAMRKRGLLIDEDYTRQLVGRLLEEKTQHEASAARYGVANVNSTAQVIDALQGMGEKWKAKTATGNASVGKEALLPLADLDRDWARIGARDPNPVADAVIRAKRAGKWSTSYAQAFLDGMDEENRLHPSIKSLAARTARMSISDPALQQLPSSDWVIRRAILADPGQSIVSVDYQAVEMRVLAALSGDTALRQAIADGVDLHMFTAEKIAGDRWAGMDDDARKAARKPAKVTGLAKIYGGGADHISKQTGNSLEDTKATIAAYDAAFPSIKAYGQKLQRETGYGARPLITATGRHLPLDRDRTYAAVNYACQSVARDILAAALVRLDDAGLSEHLLLPIHDEVLAQGPADSAEELAHEIQRVMETELQGVHIAADPEVYGPTWGHGYGAPDLLAAA